VIPEGQGAGRTVDVLTDSGVLEPGDVLEINRGRLRNGTSIETETVEQAIDSRPDEFWQCEVIEETESTGEIRWRNDSNRYSLSAAAEAVLQEISDNEVENLGQADYWIHPEYDDQNLYELREAVLDDSEPV
jgi:hypothetical protein